MDRPHETFATRILSGDGSAAGTETCTKSARRECLFEPSLKMVDVHTCTPWSYRSLATVLTDRAML